jgi:hypothetical protein
VATALSRPLIVAGAKHTRIDLLRLILMHCGIRVDFIAGIPADIDKIAIPAAMIMQFGAK